MYADTRDELTKIRLTLATIAAQLDRMESDEEIEFAGPIGYISDSVRAAINKADKALLMQDDEAQDSEPTPEQQYQRTEPRQWQVGDLVRDSAGLKLCVQREGQYSTWICDTGTNWIADDIRQKGSVFVRNTGLPYIYTNIARLQLDYMNGFFTPYFEIL